MVESVSKQSESGSSRRLKTQQAVSKQASPLVVFECDFVENALSMFVCSSERTNRGLCSFCACCGPRSDEHIRRMAAGMALFSRQNIHRVVWTEPIDARWSPDTLTESLTPMLVYLTQQYVIDACSIIQTNLTCHYICLVVVVS